MKLTTDSSLRMAPERRKHTYGSSGILGRILATTSTNFCTHQYSNIFGLNETFMTDINARAEKCGYFAFMENALTFPPLGPLPTAPNSSEPGCAVWEDIIDATVYINPCFNIYHLIDYCPYLWDQLGFPSLGWGPVSDLDKIDIRSLPSRSLILSPERLLQPHRRAKGHQRAPNRLHSLWR